MVSFSTSMKVSSYDRKLLQLFSNANRSGLWKMIDRQMRFIILWMFQNWGGAYGRPTWPAISETMWGLPRIGTDGATHGVFSPRSNPLDAGGDYKRSFKTLKSTARTIEWGSDLDVTVWTADGEEKFLANIMPYTGWKDNPKGDVAKYMPRYAMPDPLSKDFADDMRTVHGHYIAKVLMQAKFEAKMEDVGVTNIMRNDALDRNKATRGDDDL